MAEPLRHYACRVQSFAHWRQTARSLLAAGIAPAQVHWTDGTRAEASLFDDLDVVPTTASASTPRIPSGLLEMLELAACHDAGERWSLLYRVVWRWTRGERACLNAGDADGVRLQGMIRAVRREIHHLHAFVRFREQVGSEPRFVAWIEPAYPVLHLAASYFVDRMGKVSWLIATPWQTVASDGGALALGPGMAPPSKGEGNVVTVDIAEALWAAYYRSTFNPARLNPALMRGHMPTRWWKNLPEAAQIPALIGAAAAGEARVAQSSEVSERPGRRIPDMGARGHGT